MLKKRKPWFLIIVIMSVVGCQELFGQSLGTTSSSFCTGLSINIYIQGGYPCGGANVSSPSGWQINPSPSSVTYNQNGQGYYNSINVTWNSPATPSITASYTCDTDFSSGTTSPLNFSVTSNVTPAVSLGTNSPSLCQGSGSITLTATPTNGGTPSYNFYVDGASVYSGASSSLAYNTSGLAPGSHSTYVTMYSNLACVTASSATSTTVNFSVAAKASYSATFNTPGQICSASPSAPVSVNVTSGVGNLSYQWFLNGSSIGTTTVPYTTYPSVSNGNTATCIVSSDYWCVNSTVQTNTITFSVTGSVTPAVGIQIPQSTYCSGQTITFTASGSNITGSSTYLWYLNGSQISTASAISLTSNSSVVAGQFYPGSIVTLTVNGLSGTCLTSTTANGTTSGTPITINPTVTPSVTLGLNSTSICNPGTIILTATPTNGGTPSYNFYVDGVSVYSGASSSFAYNTSGLAPGSHSTYVTMYSNLTCVTASSATSTTVNFSVAAKASYSATFNTPGQICSASPSAPVSVNVTSGVGNLSYQWFLNGSSIGTTTVPYTTYPSVSNGNTATCIVSSDYWCVNSTVQTNTITFSVTGSVTPAVGIQIPQSTYCSGQTITFTASGSNITGSSTYLWYLNGSQISTASAISLTSNSSVVAGQFYPGSIVTLTVNGLSGTCLTSTTANGTTSGTPITINPTVTPSVTLGLNSTSICNPGTIILTATPTNGGSAPLYTFYIDGLQVASGSSNSFSSSSLSVASHNAYVVMTSNAQCLTQTTAPSSTQNFTIANKATYTVQVNGPGQICSANASDVYFMATVATPPPSGTLTYQWYFNGNAVGSLSTNNFYTFASVSAGNTIYCRVYSDYWCVNTNVPSNTYTVVITPTIIPTVSIQFPQLNYCPGQVINLTASSTYGGTSFVWRVNGNTLATTTSPATVVPVTASATAGALVYYNGGGAITLDVTGLSGTCVSSTSASATTSGSGLNVYALPDVAANPTTTQTICSGLIAPIAITNPNAVSGTTFSWTVSAPGITGASAGSGNSITQTLTNSTTSDQTAIYTITPTANGCVGSSITRSVIVKLKPTLSSSLTPTAIASGSIFSYNPASVTVGATFTWTRAAVAGILEGSANGTGNPNEILRNSTLNAIPVIYLFITTANGCSNAAQSVVVSVLPPPYPNENYIITHTLMVDNVTNPTTIDNLLVEQRSQAIQYFDGLGRPMQTVVTKGSPSALDIVQPIVYDEFGREKRKYLPFTAGSNGWYKPNNSIIDASGNFIGVAQPFYTNTSDNIADDGKPYSEAIFEPSPLNRTIEQGAPGTSWQPDLVDSYTSTDRTIKKAYEVNVASEVLYWTFTPPDPTHPFGQISAGTIASPIYYAPNQLYKNKTKDEEHHEVIEYVDKQGRTVLKRVQATGSQIVNDTNYASTYYIYDDFGNLVTVLPPEAVKALTN